jgi:hypothetical protein
MQDSVGPTSELHKGGSWVRSRGNCKTSVLINRMSHPLSFHCGRATQQVADTPASVQEGQASKTAGAPTVACFITHR